MVILLWQTENPLSADTNSGASVSGGLLAVLTLLLDAACAACREGRESERRVRESTRENAYLLVDGGEGEKERKRKNPTIIKTHAYHESESKMRQWSGDEKRRKKKMVVEIKNEEKRIIQWAVAVAAANWLSFQFTANKCN